jgi:1-aminocyclopropane-1-carboxylate deaminase/D-cysteine desulfhydrase-like pyridoxal-dependent ACC family enzyme
VLDRVLGAEIIWAGELKDSEAFEQAIAHQVRRLTELGHKPYAVAAGASSPLGAMGYVGCATELQAQLPDVTVVVTATGSGGTHAGLVAGFGDHGRVYGVRVGERPGLEAHVEGIAEECARLASLPSPAGHCVIDHAQLGSGYGAHTVATAEAMLLAARTEGLLLDPVYTGKAMAGLIAGCRAGRWRNDRKIVFLHTGGLPGLLSDQHASWASDYARG